MLGLEKSAVWRSELWRYVTYRSDRVCGKLHNYLVIFRSKVSKFYIFYTILRPPCCWSKEIHQHGGESIFYPSSITLQFLSFIHWMVHDLFFRCVTVKTISSQIVTFWACPIDSVNPRYQAPLLKNPGFVLEWGWHESWLSLKARLRLTTCYFFFVSSRRVCVTWLYLVFIFIFLKIYLNLFFYEDSYNSLKLAEKKSFS